MPLASRQVVPGHADSHPACVHDACRCGHGEVARVLAESGAKLELLNKRGLTPLAEAMAVDAVDAATAMLECGASVDASVRGCVPCPHMCAAGKCRNIYDQHSAVGAPHIHARGCMRNVEGMSSQYNFMACRTCAPLYARVSIYLRPHVPMCEPL